MIKINGKDYGEESISLIEFIKLQDFDTQKIAVELNGNIIKRGTYDEYVLHDGDSLEIVCFVGGG
ncbi:MAG: sulfur carrier protein ThiS [Peptostreptococcus sp.]|uniref:sulfur carrier protein ThiS n=1 Tax=Peptostreptococcus sp. TaxID=1262 RepID=UPI002FC666D3